MPLYRSFVRSIYASTSSRCTLSLSKYAAELEYGNRTAVRRTVCRLSVGVDATKCVGRLRRSATHSTTPTSYYKFS